MRRLVRTLAVAGVLTVLSGLNGSGATAGDSEPLFAPPVQIMSAGKPMGNGILYPSPKLQDLDGDGSPELLIGDLRGSLQFARRLPGNDATQWSALESLTTADGKPIKFDNW